MRKRILLHITFCSIAVISIVFVPTALCFDLRNTTWVDNNLECLSFSDTTATFELMDYSAPFCYVITGDSLDLFSRYQLSNNENQPTHIWGLSFLIESLSSDSITIRPCQNHKFDIFSASSLKKCLLDSNRAITLYRPSLFYDSSLVFIKILFTKQGGCWVYYDTKAIIDSAKNLYYQGGKNESIQGFYHGILSDSLYSEFISLLKKSALDELLPAHANNINDEVLVITNGPNYTFDIYYNGKHAFTETPYRPLFRRDLFNFLCDIEQNVPLKKSKIAKNIFKHFNEKN